MSPDDFVAVLVAAVPEVRPLVSDHFATYDELFIHLLMGDLQRLAVEAFHSGQPDVVRRVLDQVARALQEGDDALENAVAVSFVEGAGYGQGETKKYLRAWPKALMAELERQRNWQP